MGNPRQRTILNTFGRGIVNRGVPKLNQPPDSLVSGENAVLASGGLKTRPGYVVVSEMWADPNTVKVELPFEGPTGSTSIEEFWGRHTVTNVLQDDGTRFTIDATVYPDLYTSSLKVPVITTASNEYRLTIPDSEDWQLGGALGWNWQINVTLRRDGVIDEPVCLASWGNTTNGWFWWYNYDSGTGIESTYFQL